MWLMKPFRARPKYCASAFLALAVSLLSLALPQRPLALPVDPNGTWQRLDYAPPGRRAAGYSYDSLRRRLIVFGGYPQYLNDVWALDLATGNWQQIVASGAAPSPRYGATAVYDAPNDRLVVFGGFDRTAERNDVWALSLSGAPAWTELLPSGASPEGRSFHVALFDAPRQRMVVVGGWNGADFLNDAWDLSIAGSPAWNQLATSGPTPPARDLAGAAYDSARERLVLFGGWNGTYLNDTWALTLSGAPTWSEIVAASPPPPRREISIAYDTDDDRIVLFAGNDGTLRSDAWELPLSGAPAWQELLPSGASPRPRYGHASIYDPVADRMVIMGGLTDWAHENDAWALELDAAPAWVPLAVLPRPVRNYSAVLDPVARQLLLLGGEVDPYGALSNEMVALPLAGARANWIPIDPPGTKPTPRYAHRAVWDPVRDRMLVFGGYDGQYLNELWQYRPRPTPTWSRLFPSGAAPAPRFAGGVVFDAPRDRLLVFGGYSIDPLGPSFNDLWALSLSGPSSMTWELLAPTGTPPTPRWGFVMVMDPGRDRALSFGGGSSASAPTNQVFALRLGSQPPNWVQLFPAGALPSPRIIHAAVIEPVGDRLVAFGGYSGVQFLDDTWALSLSGVLQWTQLNPSGGSPAARDAIGAIYDAAGGRMVVPCGFNEPRFFRDVWALSWDVAVPVEASLVESLAEPGLVRLSWFVRDAAMVEARVERRQGSGAWLVLGAPQRTALDRLSYEDRAVAAEARYEYRLRLRRDGEEMLTAPVAVEVPSGYALALAGAQPNPATSDLWLAFSLPRRMEARLEVTDVGGRRVAAREVGSLGAGRHRVQLGEGIRLVPGVYVIRLVAGESALTARALVIR